MPETPPESFLRRWSSRKTANATEDEAPISAPVAEEIPPQPLSESPSEAVADPATTAVDATPPEDKVLTDADMPPLESLNSDSDYSGFLSRGVSRELRQLALRKLFSGAGFNLRDGLDDYDEDFTEFEPLGDIVTADMKYQQRLQAEREAAEQEAREAEEADQNEAHDGETSEDEAPPPPESQSADPSNEGESTDKNPEQHRQVEDERTPESPTH